MPGPGKAMGLALPPASDQRVYQGLDALGRIGVSPPSALGTGDEQSLKGLTAVRDPVLPPQLRAKHLTPMFCAKYCLDPQPESRGFTGLRRTMHK